MGKVGDQPLNLTPLDFKGTQPASTQQSSVKVDGHKWTPLTALSYAAKKVGAVALGILTGIVTLSPSFGAEVFKILNEKIKKPESDHEKTASHTNETSKGTLSEKKDTLLKTTAKSYGDSKMTDVDTENPFEMMQLKQGTLLQNRPTFILPASSESEKLVSAGKKNPAEHCKSLVNEKGEFKNLSTYVEFAKSNPKEFSEHVALLAKLDAKTVGELLFNVGKTIGDKPGSALADNLVKILEPKTLATLIKVTLKNQIGVEEQGTALFRSAPLALKLLTRFIDNHIKPILKDDKNGLTKLIMNTPESKVVIKEFEKGKEGTITIDEEAGEKLQEFATGLLGKVGEIINKNTHPNLALLKDICQDEKMNIKQKFGDEELGQIVSGNNLFLRALCPMLLMPNSFDIREGGGTKAMVFQGSQLENLKLVSKMIQNGVNNIEAKIDGKEKHMMAFNTWTKENKNLINEILTSVNTAT